MTSEGSLRADSYGDDLPETGEHDDSVENALQLGYLKKAQARGIPESLVDGLALYVVSGIRTGSFLEAVLANDLMDAFGRADEDCSAGMVGIVKFIYNDLPGDCHGSREAVDNWCKRRGLVGMGRKA